MTLRRSSQLIATAIPEELTIGADNLRIEVVFFDLGDTLVTTADRLWISGAEQALEFLDNSNIRLGLISDSGDLTRQQLLTLLPINFSFDFFADELVNLSSETGIEKDEPVAFLNAAVRARAIPSRCLFIGEDVEELIVAQTAGFKSLRFTHADDVLELLEKALVSETI